MNYVYIVKCKDSSLYTGWTNDINKRLLAHNSGTGAKYTRGRTPVTLVYLEIFEKKEDALKRESNIKKLSREKKWQLIKSYDPATD